MSGAVQEAVVPEGPVGEVPPRWRPGRGLAAIAGITAAAVGLGVAEVVAATSTGLRSPVVSVGDRVVEGAPPWLKDFAISTFGTADKPALIIGTLVLLAGFAALVGVVALRRSLAAGLVGVAAFAAVGVAATVASPVDGWGQVWPSLVAGSVAAATLVGLQRWWARAAGSAAAAGATAPESAGGEPGPAGPPAVARRRFLVGVGAAVAVAASAGAVGRWMARQARTTAARLGIALPEPGSPLPPAPAGASLEVRGISPLFTPNSDFYRIDTALVSPVVEVEGWRLGVTGMVERPFELTFEELLDRPMIEADVTIACVSNEVGGSLVGTARWLGCRLDDLLDEAGIDPRADQVVGRSVDGFTAGFPTAVLDGRDAIVAVAMNGEPLPVDHGFPARLIVPGLYGYVSATKWLQEIELTRFDEFQAYWVPRGWSAEGPIKTQSRIDTPRGGSVAAGEVPVAGVAWAPTRGIRRVEVRVDEGPWQEATLAEELAGTTWRQWWWEWEATPGRHVLEVRATDGDGDVQTGDRSPPAPDGATGWHRVAVQVG